MDTKQKMKIDTRQMLITMEMKAKLSTTWIFVLFNILFRDVHELFRTGFLAEMMAGIVNGTQITEELMLIAGITLEISIVMVLMSRILPYRFNRPANIIVGAITIVFTISNGTNDLDDIWFLAVVIAALLYVIWSAWTWKKQETESTLSVS